MSTSFFVAADWLAEHIDDPEIQIIDARMAPAGQEALRDMAAEYRAGHVPNALFFDIEALSDHTSPLPHMMPRAEAFAVAPGVLSAAGAGAVACGVPLSSHPVNENAVRSASDSAAKRNGFILLTPRPVGLMQIITFYYALRRHFSTVMTRVSAD